MIRYAIALLLAVTGCVNAPAFAWGQDPGSPSRNPEVAEVPRSNAGDFSMLDSAPVGRVIFPAQGAGLRWAQPFDALQAGFGLQLAEADDSLRAQLAVPPGQGVVVVGVKPGGLAEQAGLKPNDVLMNLGEQRVMGVNQARGMLLAIGKEATEVKLIRGGKARRMSLVGPEHGFPPEAAEFWIGVPVSPVDPTLRSHLAALPPDAGLIANDVVADSPAAQAGVKKNDVLVKMGDRPLKNSDSLIRSIQDSGGKPRHLEIIRAGEPIRLSVTPAKRAHPTTINLINKPDIHYRVVQPPYAVQIPEMDNQVLSQQGEKALSSPRGYSGPLTAAPNSKYDAIVVNPNRVDALPPSPPASEPMNFHVEMKAPRAWAEGDRASARIEAQLKDLSAKMDELRKAVEGLKKAERR